MIGRLCWAVSLYSVVMLTFDQEMMFTLNAAMWGAMSSSREKFPLYSSVTIVRRSFSNAAIVAQRDGYSCMSSKSIQLVRFWLFSFTADAEPWVCVCSSYTFLALLLTPFRDVRWCFLRWIRWGELTAEFPPPTPPIDAGWTPEPAVPWLTPSEPSPLIGIIVSNSSRWSCSDALLLSDTGYPAACPSSSSSSPSRSSSPSPSGPSAFCSPSRCVSRWRKTSSSVVIDTPYEQMPSISRFVRISFSMSSNSDTNEFTASCGRIEDPQHRSRPRETTALRSAKMSASSMKCVVSRITLPCLRFCRMDHMCRREYGSTPAVGSSRMMIFGSPMIAMPTESFRFCPPLRCLTLVSAVSNRSISRSVFFTSLSTSDGGIPRTAAKKYRCSLGVSVSKRMSCCGQTPVIRRIIVMSFGSRTSYPKM
uniref:Uncharacterized protein n=1 Tax=Anopheles atroparvus TaxID=41427 RepID=A0A182JG19_ANOAO